MKCCCPSWGTLAVIALVGGCGTSEPEPEVTLDYAPVQLLISGTINVDALAEGATISLSLREGGFVIGSLFLPAAATGADELTANMAGSWVKRGDTITFNQVSTTFVSEVPWILDPLFLTAADSFDGNFYDVVLERIFQ